MTDENWTNFLLKLYGFIIALCKHIRLTCIKLLITKFILKHFWWQYDQNQSCFDIKLLVFSNKCCCTKFLQQSKSSLIIKNAEAPFYETKLFGVIRKSRNHKFVRENERASCISFAITGLNHFEQVTIIASLRFLNILYNIVSVHLGLCRVHLFFFLQYYQLAFLCKS